MVSVVFQRLVGWVTPCDQLSTCSKCTDIVLTNKNKLLNNTNNMHDDSKDSRRKDWSSNKHNLDNDYKHHDLHCSFQLSQTPNRLNLFVVAIRNSQVPTEHPKFPQCLVTMIGNTTCDLRLLHMFCSPV